MPMLMIYARVWSPEFPKVTPLAVINHMAGAPVVPWGAASAAGIAIAYRLSLTGLIARGFFTGSTFTTAPVSLFLIAVPSLSMKISRIYRPSAPMLSLITCSRSASTCIGVSLIAMDCSMKPCMILRDSRVNLTGVNACSCAGIMCAS